MSDLKPITLHGHFRSANPWKVVMILEELGLPYKHVFVDLAKAKQEPFISINPNGRVPAIEDPNTGITLWESGAIIEYLVETYDKDNKISHGAQAFPQRYLEKQYLHFQMSGQGPYYGQYYWFSKLHPEKVESAIKRYEEQTLRVVGVLDRILEGKNYLVGDKATYADISFIAWDSGMRMLFPDIVAEHKKHKNFEAWYQRLTERPAIKKAFELRAEAMAKEGH